MDTIHIECQNKMSLKDGQRLWRQYQRFAEYEDLRELYQRCIPEISKFEIKIIDFQAEIERFKLMIRNFDENMIHKADKTSIK